MKAFLLIIFLEEIRSSTRREIKKTELKVSLRMEKPGDLILLLILKRRKESPRVEGNERMSGKQEVSNLKSCKFSLLDKVWNDRLQGHFSANIPG